MAAPARKPLTAEQIRAISIKRRIARRAHNDNQPRARRTMPAALLADCIAAGGFDQNERFA